MVDRLIKRMVSSFYDSDFLQNEFLCWLDWGLDAKTRERTRLVWYLNRVKLNRLTFDINEHVSNGLMFVNRGLWRLKLRRGPLVDDG